MSGVPGDVIIAAIKAGYKVTTHTPQRTVFAKNIRRIEMTVHGENVKELAAYTVTFNPRATEEGWRYQVENRRPVLFEDISSL